MPLQQFLKNEIFAVIRRAGLDPAEFDWTLRAQRQNSQEVLLHEPSGSYFDFIYENAQWAYVYEPGVDTPHRAGRAGTWPYELLEVNRWLGAVRREVETPDLWAELERERAVLARPSADDGQNTPFEARELEHISAQIGELKEYVRAAYDLNEAQQRELQARLDYVEGAARGWIGRVDWWNLFVGSLVNLVLTQIVPPGAVQALLVLAAHGLAGLFGGGVPELPGGAGPAAPGL